MVGGDDEINRLVESDEGVREFADAVIGERHGLDVFIGMPSVVRSHVSGVAEVDEHEVKVFGGGGSDGHFDDVIVAIGDVGASVAVVDVGGFREADFAEGWDGVEHSDLLVSLGDYIYEGGNGAFEAIQDDASCAMDVGGDASEEGLLSGEGKVGVDGFYGLGG